MENNFFNANHSPIGAFASFTLGFPGASGGPGMERRGPADTNVYIGAERREGGSFESFPFFKGGEDEGKRYDVEKQEKEEPDGYFDKIPASGITRDFRVCSDTWRAGDLTFTLYNQAEPVPDPQDGQKGGNEEQMKLTILPAVMGELTIDNRGCKRTRRAFFGFDEVETRYGMRQLISSEIKGAGQGGTFAVFSNSPCGTAVGFCPECILAEDDRENWKFNLGKTALLIFDVPADTKVTYPLVICFYHGAQATYGIDTKYYYTKYFAKIEEVAAYGLKNFDVIRNRCLSANQRFDRADFTEEQRFMLWHAIKSYYNSSQFLINEEGEPVWVINEGEFRMMNTMDLTVDQLFFEMKMNPWTVKNVLDFYLNHYSYEDQCGLTFCHDMGVANIFTRQGKSAYEKCGLTDCFSYMSHEQLVNWICCALIYIRQSGDGQWGEERRGIIKKCFESMLNRDHPVPQKRNGVMGIDSTMTKGGAEITTYDSLDISLGQARNNIYLAGKCWAAYVCLEEYFAAGDEAKLAALAADQAAKCAETIADHLNEEGYIPAVMDEDNDSRIIPAIEGLVFPYVLGRMEVLQEDGKYGRYIKALKKHFVTIMESGICIFGDGGWKLSSTSGNSWLSKIYLCEFVAAAVLGFDRERYMKDADQAHVRWLTDPEHSYWCWSDQIVNGVISASKYYPRGVTSILWMEESESSDERF